MHQITLVLADQQQHLAQETKNNVLITKWLATVTATLHANGNHLTMTKMTPMVGVKQILLMTRLRAVAEEDEAAEAPEEDEAGIKRFA